MLWGDGQLKGENASNQTERNNPALDEVFSISRLYHTTSVRFGASMEKRQRKMFICLSAIEYEVCVV